ncbi:MAG: xanthine dehydrogenase family protein subunit M [Gammaproteobacteria bacterium]|nr:xanthine dehydrogenase family protein subunit M [Gammaproteobacteria bacterium]
MYEFNYHRPASLDEAKRILSGNDEAKLLGGGMTLLPTMKMRLAQPSDLVDLSAIASLSGIEVAGDSITIGAMTTHAQVAASAEVSSRIAALSVLASGIGDAQVRNRGTIGGSVANSDPAADYPAAVLGLNATVITDEREIAADDFFTGMFETALGPQEILTAIRFPLPKRAGYAKFPNPASRYAVAGVMVAETGNGVRVAVTGAGANAYRVSEMESALSANFSASALDGLAVDASELNGDLHASPEYRAHLVVVMAKRAVAAAGG